MNATKNISATIVEKVLILEEILTIISINFMQKGRMIVICVMHNLSTGIRWQAIKELYMKESFLNAITVTKTLLTINI